MKTIMYLTALYLACFTSIFADSQSLPDYWTNLKKGRFTVGFKSLCVFDTSRDYDLACGDSTAKLKAKKIGRPILINIWYPAKRTNDTAVLKIKDYFDFPADDNTVLFFTKLKAFQLQYSKLYSVDGNMKEKDFAGDLSLREKAKIAAFESYISSKTIAHKNAKPEDGAFPVIVYHQGLGGTIDENALLLEYLASNGYIVINSAFQRTNGSGFADGWNTGTGDQRATFDDINFIINYVKQHNLSGSKKIFLMGHSYGANSSIGFPGQGHKNVDGIIPLDSDLGYVLYSFYPAQYNPFVKDKLKFYNIPVFCVGRKEAHFRMVDSLSLSKRYYLTIPDMRHNDFTSQGAIGRYYCFPYIKEQQLYKQVTGNYLSMCSNILRFLSSYTKNGTGLGKKDIHLYNGWGFETSNPGEKLPFNRPFDESTQKCPTISQFLDLVYNSGLKKSGEIYTRCTDTSFKNNETLMNILDALCFDSKADMVIEYLNWMNEQKVAENNLKDIFSMISYNSLFNSGNGFHFEKADSIYNWMIENFSANKYGYMGRLLVSFYTKGKDQEFYCKKILELEPDFQNTKTQSFLEQTARNVIQDYLKKN
jgi:hypothetical protein